VVVDVCNLVGVCVADDSVPWGW